MTGLDVLRQEILALAPWHHDIELPGGIRTGDPALARQGPDGDTPTIVRPQDP